MGAVDVAAAAVLDLALAGAVLAAFTAYVAAIHLAAAARASRPPRPRH